MSRYHIPAPLSISRFSPPANSTLSTTLFTTFVYPFELTSFLILVAIMGALVLAQREKT